MIQLLKMKDFNHWRSGSKVIKERSRANVSSTSASRALQEHFYVDTAIFTGEEAASVDNSAPGKHFLNVWIICYQRQEPDPPQRINMSCEPVIHFIS